MRKESFVLKTPEELVGQRKPEPMSAAVCVVTLPVDGRFIGKVCRTPDDKHARRMAARNVARVNMDVDGTPLSFLASPPVKVVLVALIGNSVDHAGHWPCMWTLKCNRVRGRQNTELSLQRQ